MRLIHLPVHASWLNQIELYFSIVQRKALTPNDFPDLEALAERLTGFADQYRQIARPFKWTFTRHNLNKVIDRIANSEPQLGSPPKPSDFWTALLGGTEAVHEVSTGIQDVGQWWP